MKTRDHETVLMASRIHTALCFCSAANLDEFEKSIVANLCILGDMHSFSIFLCVSSLPPLFEFGNW